MFMAVWESVCGRTAACAEYGGVAAYGGDAVQAAAEISGLCAMWVGRRRRAVLLDGVREREGTAVVDIARGGPDLSRVWDGLCAATVEADVLLKAMFPGLESFAGGAGRQYAED